MRHKQLASVQKFSTCDLAAVALACSAVLCLLGMFSIWLLAAGTVGGIVSGGFLAFGKQGRDRRSQASKFLQGVEHYRHQLERGAGSISSRHRERKSAFDASVEELKQAYNHYLAEGDQLQDVLVLQRKSQLNRFLAGHLIQDHVVRIPGMSFSMVSILASYGVESALDVDNLKLMGVPMLSPAMILELKSWRASVEAKFVFKPDHGVSFKDIQAARADVIQRFKISQARKVLMAAKQLESLADAGSEALQRELSRFDEASERCRTLANQLRDYESSRRRIERELNKSPTVTMALMFGAPVVGLLLYLIFG